MCAVLLTLIRKRVLTESKCDSKCNLMILRSGTPMETIRSMTGMPTSSQYIQTIASVLAIPKIDVFVQLFLCVNIQCKFTQNINFCLH